jgi:hypothetical protein
MLDIENMSAGYNRYYYPPNNADRSINNINFIEVIAAKIRKELKRPISSGEKQYLINFIRKINPKNLRNQRLNDVVNTLSTIISKELRNKKCVDDTVDTHEMLKNEIGLPSDVKSFSDIEPISSQTTNITAEINAEQVISDVTVTSVSHDDAAAPVQATNVDVVAIMGRSSDVELTRMINPLSFYRNNYIMLDSRYRLLNGSDGTNNFKWNYANNKTLTQGSVNAVGVIRDIVAIRVFPLRIPYTSTADFPWKRVTMEIEEFSAQSFVGQENRRFHFMFDAEIDGRWINLKPNDFNDGYYRFYRPVTQISTLTVTFGSPLEPVVFNTDRSKAEVSLYQGITTEITTVNDHNLQTGDIVYLSGFSSQVPNNDAIVIAGINAQHFATVVTGTTFTVPITSTSIQFQLTGTISVVNGTSAVTGAGTLFTSELSVGDRVRIVDTLTIARYYLVTAITDNLNLVVSEVYAGATEGGINIFRDHATTGTIMEVYFGEKRLFIPLELTYIQSGSDVE